MGIKVSKGCHSIETPALTVDFIPWFCSYVFFSDQVTIFKAAEFEWLEGVSVALGTVCL